jgi:hypothetical protein
MICSGCNTFIPISQPVYCCIDKTFCSTKCSKKQFTIIQDNDPSLDNPHNWNNILDNNNELDESQENDIEFIISIKRSKTRNNIFINMVNIPTINNEKKYIINKYIKLYKLDKLIKNALFVNIICKYKLHIISLILYSIIIYGIYKLISSIN